MQDATRSSNTIFWRYVSPRPSTVPLFRGGYVLATLERGIDDAHRIRAEGCFYPAGDTRGAMRGITRALPGGETRAPHRLAAEREADLGSVLMLASGSLAVPLLRQDRNGDAQYATGDSRVVTKFAAGRSYELTFGGGLDMNRQVWPDAIELPDVVEPKVLGNGPLQLTTGVPLAIRMAPAASSEPTVVAFADSDGEHLFARASRNGKARVSAATIGELPRVGILAIYRYSFELWPFHESVVALIGRTITRCVFTRD